MFLFIYLLCCYFIIIPLQLWMYDSSIHMIHKILAQWSSRRQSCVLNYLQSIGKRRVDCRGWRRHFDPLHNVHLLFSKTVSSLLMNQCFEFPCRDAFWVSNKEGEKNPIKRWKIEGKRTDLQRIEVNKSWMLSFSCCSGNKIYNKQ